ncbi:conserved hypothetical protein [Parasynechococcus marenigrum WH 8102]|uniref:J domain-containing protein n=1 Tax=Parasynechococcus marenigrum (strain WH8102) TaxID=84588 RepID=Q7U6L0_PARMW|nr:conserved hypothetical protein [Parasynechococcus marenigrum WH 8102]
MVSLPVAKTTGFGGGEADSGGFGGGAGSSGKKSAKRKPGKANHRREQCPMGRDPDIDAIKARQSLGLPLTGRLTEQQVKRAHKLLAVKHHPDKGGDPELMTRYNNARDVLLEPEMEAIVG